MLISHISDIHLGYSQFNLLERENDIYDAFEEAVNQSISEHADLVILAGDIFHNPRPSGSSIVKLADELKKFREASIPVYFILGEHDMSRIKDTPVPYLFHNMKLASLLEDNQPIRVGALAIFGFNKERRSNIETLLQKLQVAEKLAKQQKENYDSRNILVLHQGLVEFNKFAGELSRNNLPKGFDYYAMGHYHDHIEETFSYFDGVERTGLIAYPGSIDLSPSDGLRDIKKGFFLTDMSAHEPSPNWIKLETRRPVLAFNLTYRTLHDEISAIIQKTHNCKKKPIVALTILGEKIDSKIVTMNLSALNDYCLHYVWRTAKKHNAHPDISSAKPIDINREIYNLARKSLNSDELAAFAINEILPAASAGDLQTVLDIVWKVHNNKMKHGINNL
jgi:DNA repair protein SbcD/Mre11